MWLAFRKFGLDYDDFSTMIENVSILMIVLTINIYKKSTKRINLIFYIITTVTGFCYIHVYVVSTFWMVFFRYNRSEELELMALVISLSLCSITCITKLIFMKIYSKDIQETVDHFLKCDAHVIPDTRFAKNLRKNLKVIKRRAIIIWISLVGDSMIYMMIPFLTPGRHFTVDKYLIYGLEPMFESPNFEIATLIFMMGICFGAVTLANVLAYIIVIVGYNESQMRALSEELRNIWDDSQHFYNNVKHKVTDKINVMYYKEKIVDEFIKHSLRRIVKFHIANINLSHEVDQNFRQSLALEFSIMAFAIIAELLGGLDKTYLEIPFTLSQIFMNCFIGQRLIDASNDFEKSLYTCKWENFNTTNQKTVYLMLIMSQKTLTLSAGGVTKLNFNCLMKVLKSAFSVYTTLKSALK